MIPDYHIHTPLCKHASGIPEQYMERAAELNIPELCFADHAPAPDGYDPNSRMAIESFPEYQQWIDTCRHIVGPAVYYGIEADYYDGCEDFLGSWLEKNPFDLVIGSVHYIKEWGFDNPSEKGRWKQTDVLKAWQSYFEILGRLVKSGLFDVVGHLDLPKKFGYRPEDSHIIEMARPVLKDVASKGMGIEINTAGLRKPIGEIYPSETLLLEARKHDIPICFGSDAHKPEDVGAGFEDALAMARKAGYEDYLVIRQRQLQRVPLPAGPA